MALQSTSPAPKVQGLLWVLALWVRRKGSYRMKLCLHVSDCSPGSTGTLLKNPCSAEERDLSPVLTMGEAAGGAQPSLSNQRWGWRLDAVKAEVFFGFRTIWHQDSNRVHRTCSEGIVWVRFSHFWAFHRKVEVRRDFWGSSAPSDVCFSSFPLAVPTIKYHAL